MNKTFFYKYGTMLLAAITSSTVLGLIWPEYSMEFAVGCGMVCGFFWDSIWKALTK